MNHPGRLAITLLAAALAVAATGCGSGRLEESTAPAATPVVEAPPTEETITPATEPEPSEEPTPEGTEFSGAGSWSDFNKYQYSVSYNVELGNPKADPADARPGYTYLSVPRQWEITLANETGGGHAIPISSVSWISVVGLYPNDSPLCTEVDGDPSTDCGFYLGQYALGGGSPSNLADGDTVGGDATGYGPLKILISEDDVDVAAEDILNPKYVFAVASRMDSDAPDNCQFQVRYHATDRSYVVVSDATEPACDAYVARME